MPKILIADDQYEILIALKLLLKQEGFQIEMASSPEAVLQQAGQTAFDVILIDLNYTRDTTSGREGLDLIASLRAIPHAAPVIVMTAWSNVPLAVDAMRLGASDFIEKPWDNMRLLSVLQKHLHSHPNRSQRGIAAAADLEIARSVQSRLLPQRMPAIPTLDYAVKYEPAGVVGGDYYDFLPAGDDAVAFVVADVSGKGISAAILMATIQSYFRSREPYEFLDLIALISGLNALFYRSSPSEQYATLFLMRYEGSTRIAEWVNCGHTPPLLAKTGQPAVELMPSATVLGMFPHWVGEALTCAIDASDTLLIFSDGVTEAPDPDQQEFGAERLTATCEKFRDLAALDLVHSIGAAIHAHCQGPLADDLTILALRGRAVDIFGDPAQRDAIPCLSELRP